MRVLLGSMFILAFLWLSGLFPLDRDEGQVCHNACQVVRLNMGGHNLFLRVRSIVMVAWLAMAILDRLLAEFTMSRVFGAFVSSR